MNAGAYVTEISSISWVCIIRAIHDNFGSDFDGYVFGPAWLRGISIVITAMGLQELYGKEVRYCSNRKEASTTEQTRMLRRRASHDGEDRHGGRRTGIEETYPPITSIANVKVKGFMVSLNRMEVGKAGNVCALQGDLSATVSHRRHRNYGKR